jgi:hypothetical protein
MDKGQSRLDHTTSLLDRAHAAHGLMRHDDRNPFSIIRRYLISCLCTSSQFMTAPNIKSRRLNIYSSSRLLHLLLPIIVLIPLVSNIAAFGVQYLNNQCRAPSNWVPHHPQSGIVTLETSHVRHRHFAFRFSPNHITFFIRQSDLTTR